MSETFSVRMPQELKEKMRRLNIEWSKEIRSFIEERVIRLELMEAIESASSRAEKRRVKVDSTVLIREDREQ